MGLLSAIFSCFFALSSVALAPPLTPRLTTDNPPVAASPTPTPASPSAEAIEDESEIEVRRPIQEKVKRATLPAAHTPAQHGQTSGPSFIAQRTLVEDYCGWGWIRSEGQKWSEGRWIALEATPGVCPIPHTFLPRPEDDKNQKYKFYGEFAPYRAYEPQADMWVDVFILKGFMSLGPAEPIRRDPPAHGSSRPNRFADRAPNFLQP